jgi:cysteine desulfuration protein SufE
LESNLTFEQIKEDLDLFDGWEDRYGYIIDLGKSVELDEEKKVDSYKVNGCASQVWLEMSWQERESGKHFLLKGDSDAMIVKGLIAILLSLYNNKHEGHVKAVNPREEFAKLGLNNHLSSQRSNGLKSMIERIRIFVNN